MVLEMMNTDTTSKMAMRAMLMTPATFRAVMNPAETASSARTLAICSTPRRASTVWESWVSSCK